MFSHFETDAREALGFNRNLTHMDKGQLSRRMSAVVEQGRVRQDGDDRRKQILSILDRINTAANNRDF